MQVDEIVLVVEDTARCATWQVQAMESKFPDKRVVLARNLKEAHDALNDDRLDVYGMMTDNGYPLVRGGERIGSKSIEGGAGTLLIKQIRSGKFGDKYQDLRVAWHTAKIDERKIERVLGYEDMMSEGSTACFEKEDGPWGYEDMGDFLKH
jgi:hypothetical protein